MDAPLDPATPAPPTQPARLSGWALAALLCGLMPFCAPIAPLLGWRALHEIRTRPGRTGRRMAWSGIGLGLVFGAVWVALGIWWNRQARQPMTNGPIVELRAGLSGDVTSFSLGFIDGSEDEAGIFLSALAERFGALSSMAQRPDDDIADTSPPELVIPYVMEFEAGLVEAEAAFIVQNERGQLELRWAWLAVRDPIGGDLVYPSSMRDKAAAAREPPEVEPQ